MMNISLPSPVIIGSTSPCAAQVAMAASTALPPDLRMRRPASEARGGPDATMPWSDITTGRQVEVCAWASSGTKAKRHSFAFMRDTLSLGFEFVSSGWDPLLKAYGGQACHDSVALSIQRITGRGPFA